MSRTKSLVVVVKLMVLNAKHHESVTLLTGPRDANTTQHLHFPFWFNVKTPPASNHLGRILQSPQTTPWSWYAEPHCHLQTSQQIHHKTNLPIIIRLQIYSETSLNIICKEN